MAHTAEPWEIRYQHTGEVISDEKQNANAMVIFAPSKAPGFDLSCLVDGIYFKARKSGAKRGESPKWLGFFDDDECNAQRIVACVNALAGIENPQEFVEFAQSSTKVGELKKYAERIKALESLLISCAGDFGHLASMFKLEDDNSMENACLKTQAKIKKLLTQ